MSLADWVALVWGAALTAWGVYALVWWGAALTAWGVYAWLEARKLQRFNARLQGIVDALHSERPDRTVATAREPGAPGFEDRV